MYGVYFGSLYFESISKARIVITFYASFCGFLRIE